MTSFSVEIFGQKRTVQVWNYVSIMLGVGFVGGPPIGQWFTTKVVGKNLTVLTLNPLKSNNMITVFRDCNH